MKIRNGFISNSSSSSFLINVYLTEWETIENNYNNIKDFKFETIKNKTFITKQEIKKLVKFGFKETNLRDAIDVYFNRYTRDVTAPKSNLAYSVITNQDEIISFLLKNNIPFSAVEHYCQYRLLYKRNQKYVLRIWNAGEEYQMYFKHSRKEFIDNMKENKQKIIQQIPVKYYDLDETNYKKYKYHEPNTFEGDNQH